MEDRPYAGRDGPNRYSGQSEVMLERRLENIITQMNSFESEEKFRLEQQLQNVPKQYYGHVLSVMQYKFLRDRLTNIMADIVRDITPNLVRPMQELSSALIYFTGAFADNVGTYYAIYNINKHLLLGILSIPANEHAVIREKTDGLLRGTIQALSKAQILRSASERLVDAMNGFNNAVIAISGYGNTQQLEIDIRKQYAIAEEHMMTIAKYQRDLVIAKATLKQAEDMSQSDDAIQRNLEGRLKAELESATNAQQEFSKALNQDGKITEMKETNYYGRWWWWGGRYSHTTTRRIQADTSSEQASAKSKIRIADERVEEIRRRISSASRSRAQTIESSKAEIIDLETRIKEIDYRVKEAFKVARKLEDSLNSARLEAAGCNAQTRIAIASATKIAFPLFQRLTENISKVSANYDTLKSIIANAGRIGITELIGITDEMLKLAIMGDYVANNSFYICQDATMLQLEQARSRKIEEGLQIVRNAPMIEAGKVVAMKNLVDDTNGLNVASNENVFKLSADDL